MIEWGKVFEGVQRSVTPRGYSIALNHDTSTLTCFYGEAGYPVAFIGEERGLAIGNVSAQKVAARKLREAAQKHADLPTALRAG